MVRVEVEHEIGAEPSFLLHRRGIRRFVVCAGIVRMGRHPAREERPQFFFAGESQVALDDSRRPEHEAELAASKSVRKDRLCRFIVSPELVPEETSRRFFCGIRADHGSSHLDHILKSSGERPEPSRLNELHIAKSENMRTSLGAPMDRQVVAWFGTAILFLALYAGVPLAS